MVEKKFFVYEDKLGNHSLKAYFSEIEFEKGVERCKNLYGLIDVVDRDLCVEEAVGLAIKLNGWSEN